MSVMTGAEESTQRLLILYTKRCSACVGVGQKVWRVRSVANKIPPVCCTNKLHIECSNVRVARYTFNTSDI